MQPLCASCSALFHPGVMPGESGPGASWPQLLQTPARDAKATGSVPALRHPTDLPLPDTSHRPAWGFVVCLFSDRKALAQGGSQNEFLCRRSMFCSGRGREEFNQGRSIQGARRGVRGHTDTRSVLPIDTPAPWVNSLSLSPHLLSPSPSQGEYITPSWKCSLCSPLFSPLKRT